MKAEGITVSLRTEKISLKTLSQYKVCSVLWWLEMAKEGRRLSGVEVCASDSNGRSIFKTDHKKASQFS